MMIKIFQKNMENKAKAMPARPLDKMHQLRIDKKNPQTRAGGAMPRRSCGRREPGWSRGFPHCISPQAIYRALRTKSTMAKNTDPDRGVSTRLALLSAQEIAVTRRRRTRTQRLRPAGGTSGRSRSGPAYRAWSRASSPAPPPNSGECAPSRPEAFDQQDNNRRTKRARGEGACVCRRACAW